MNPIESGIKAWQRFKQWGERVDGEPFPEPAPTSDLSLDLQGHPDRRAQASWVAEVLFVGGCAKIGDFVMRLVNGEK